MAQIRLVSQDDNEWSHIVINEGDSEAHMHNLWDDTGKVKSTQLWGFAEASIHIFRLDLSCSHLPNNTHIYKN